MIPCSNQCRCVSYQCRCVSHQCRCVSHQCRCVSYQSRCVSYLCCLCLLQDGPQHRGGHVVIPPVHLELHPLHVRHPAWWLRLPCHWLPAGAQPQGLHQDGHLLPRAPLQEGLWWRHARIQTLRKGGRLYEHFLLDKLHLPIVNSQVCILCGTENTADPISPWYLFFWLLFYLCFSNTSSFWTCKWCYGYLIFYRCMWTWCYWRRECRQNCCMHCVPLWGSWREAVRSVSTPLLICTGLTRHLD